MYQNQRTQRPPTDRGYVTASPPNKASRLSQHLHSVEERAGGNFAKKENTSFMCLWRRIFQALNVKRDNPIPRDACARGSLGYLYKGDKPYLNSENASEQQIDIRYEKLAVSDTS